MKVKPSPKHRRIMISGPSGIGKTTLAKELCDYLSETYYLSMYSDEIFRSGSMSDLLPATKDISHSDMLSKDSHDLYLEDFQLLQKRKQLYSVGGKDVIFVSDRSYLDNAAYFILKQSVHEPACEIENFLGICQRLLLEQCDLLVVLPLLPSNVHDWVTESNNKRITSNYFQLHVSQLMLTALDLMGYVEEYDTTIINQSIFPSRNIFSSVPFRYGKIKTKIGDLDTLIIPSLNNTERLLTLKYFIHKHEKNNSFSIF